MKRIFLRNALLFVALVSIAVPLAAMPKPGDLTHLKVWAGKYPRDPKGLSQKGKFRNFFALAEIKRPLGKFLGLKKFKRLETVDFYGCEPIEVIEGYLVMMGTNNAQYPDTRHTLLALSLKGGEIHIWHAESGKITGDSNTETTLPWAIEKKIRDYGG